ncbi:hypothetical protein U3516DRAFT_758002 [Neocallimastix sp. 'constans']
MNHSSIVFYVIFITVFFSEALSYSCYSDPDAVVVTTDELVLKPLLPHFLQLSTVKLITCITHQAIHIYSPITFANYDYSTYSLTNSYRDGNFINSPIYIDKCVSLIDSYTLGLNNCNKFDINQIFYFNIWIDELLEPIEI